MPNVIPDMTTNPSSTFAAVESSGSSLNPNTPPGSLSPESSFVESPFSPLLIGVDGDV